MLAVPAAADVGCYGFSSGAAEQRAGHHTTAAAAAVVAAAAARNFAALIGDCYSKKASY